MTTTYLKKAAATAALSLLLVASFLLIGTAPAVAKAKLPPVPDTWKVYSYPDEGFSASFPSEPKKVDKKTSLRFDAWADGGINYTVVVSAGQRKDKAKLTFDTIAEKFGDKLKSQRDIELQGAPGREMIIEMEVEGTLVVVTNRMYLFNNHCYQSLVSVKKSKQEEAQTKKFLDSFKLIVDAPKP